MIEPQRQSYCLPLGTENTKKYGFIFIRRPRGQERLNTEIIEPQRQSYCLPLGTENTKRKSEIPLCLSVLVARNSCPE